MAKQFDCRIVLDKAKGVTVEIEEIGDAATKQVVTISMDTDTIEVAHGERTDETFQPHSRLSLGADGHVLIDCKKFTVKAADIELLATDARETCTDEDVEEQPMGSIVIDKASLVAQSSSSDDKRSYLSLDDATSKLSTTLSADETTIVTLTSARIEADAKGDGTLGLKSGDETNVELTPDDATVHGKDTANVEAGDKTSIALNSSKAVHTVGSGAILELKKTAGTLAGDLTVEKGIKGAGGKFAVAGGSGNASAPKVEAG